MSQLTYQIKQAWAGLIVKKSFLVTVVTTLGVTLGALLCILTLAYVVIFKPLPYPEQENLYQLNSNIFIEGEDVGGYSNYMNLMNLFDKQTVFSESALVYYGEGVISSLPIQPTQYITSVTPSWFTMLDSKMALGRPFEQTEAIDSYNPVAILSYETWQNIFNGDNTILEQTVTISGTSYRVVGVLAKTFKEPQLFIKGEDTNVFLPWDYNTLSETGRKSWSGFDSLQMFLGKLDSSLSTTQIDQSLTTLVNSTWKEQVASNSRYDGWSVKMELQLLKNAILGESKNAVLLLLAGVIGLVLIAFTNIINLFMSRTAEQQRQLAIQAAVGATKKHLFQALFAQSGLVVFMSVLVGLVIASGGFWVIQQFLAESLPRVNELAINSVTLGSAFFIALLFGLFIARLSANMINYRALNATLQSSGKGTGIQVSHKVRRWLVISQITIVTLLVFVNIGLLRDSLKIIHQPLGFETENNTNLTLSFNGNSELSTEEKQALMVEVKNKLMALPQVEDVSQSFVAFHAARKISLRTEGTQNQLTMLLREVDELYFQMIEQPLIEGDDFTTADIKDKNKVLIINDAYAARVAPQGSALGRKLWHRDELFTIKGVVKGVLVPGSTEVPMRVYRPVSQELPRFLLKLKPQQTLSREVIVATLQEVNSQLILLKLDTLNELRDEYLFTQYTTAITSAVLAVLTFFLATIGLYGILSYATQMRRFELGTRMAIGAKRKQLIGLVVKDNAWAILIGMATSVVVMLALYIAYQEQLSVYVGVELLGMFALTICAIGSLSLFACYWPLRKYINRPAVHSLRGSD